jgi:ferric-dicitrate binding protein FerR (iron transport regulator)
MRTPSRSAAEGGPAGTPLDQAIAWAVRLGSGSAGADAQAACAAWRAEDPSHEQAWQQVQSVEDAFREVPVLDGGGLAHGALRAAARARGRRRALGLLGAAAGAGLLGHGLWREAPWLRREDHVTAIGERRRMVLADGTELSLNTASDVQVLFSPLRRRIVLRRGELFVRTGADAGAAWGQRAFWVEAGPVRFEALGTRFGVRHEEGSARLSMAEGRVAIHAGSGATVIAQVGEGYVVRAGGAAPQRVADGSFEPDAWTDGVLVARAMRLDAFVAELGRYREAPLHCDAAAAALAVSGVFQLGGLAPVDRALEALTRTLPVRLVRAGDGSVTVARR